MTAKERKDLLAALDSMQKRVETLEEAQDEMEATLYQFEMQIMLEEEYEK